VRRLFLMPPWPVHGGPPVCGRRSRSLGDREQPALATRCDVRRRSMPCAIVLGALLSPRSGVSMRGGLKHSACSHAYRRESMAPGDRQGAGFAGGVEGCARFLTGGGRYRLSTLWSRRSGGVGAEPGESSPQPGRWQTAACWSSSFSLSRSHCVPNGRGTHNGQSQD